jgi:hypothetical protein
VKRVPPPRDKALEAAIDAARDADLDEATDALAEAAALWAIENLGALHVLSELDLPLTAELRAAAERFARAASPMYEDD